MQRSLRIAALLGVLATAGAGQAAVVMDQIGSNPADLVEQAHTSQRLEASLSTQSVASIDDFTVNSSQLQITQVQAAVLGFANFSSYNNVQSWAVEIYSSVDAAAGNLTGNVGHVDLSPASVTVNTGYATFTNSALITLPVSINLPSAGTYWVSVVPRLDFATGGQIGILESTYAAGFPKGQNAWIVNPGGFYNLTNNRENLGVDLAYRVTAVPEPASMAALALGAAALLRRRRKA